MMKRPLLSTLAIPSILFATTFTTQAEPQWIWLSKEAKANERITLRTEFEVPGPVKAATLMVACDNGATASINGQTVLQNRDWNSPEKSDAKGFLKPGKNQLALAARNQEGIAAAVAILQIELMDGQKITVETNDKWLAAPAGAGKEQKPAVVIANYGAQPWGDVFGGGGSGGKGKGKGGPAKPVIAADELQLPAGFKAELLYTVPKAEQGSWVALTVDPKGRLLAGDQYGTLYRLTLPAIGAANVADAVKVEQLTLPPDKDGKPLGGAHGLLYAFDSLYFMNNEKSGKGLWRLKDTDGDDQFDKAEFLRTMNGGGEHGTHSIVLSPDGKGLYFCNGNHTKLPDNFEESRAGRNWQEDHILPRLWDGNGHAKGILAPGGYICKTDPDGKTIEVFAYGFRNEFDIAFDQNGELFSFDSDMEWDIGMPWYRPTRIAHATSGSDQGWRSGAGKWPEYYPDSVPAALDIGPGSPTGVTFGTGAKFPAKYQRAFFALDWTYGTMYAIHLTPQGAGFKAEKEEFVAGKPLPVTDAVIHPKDGAMYFAIGGRRTQSALYRVIYTGTESTAPVGPYTLTPEMKLRRDLEKLHEPGTGADAIEKAWPHLSHADRLIRTAARVAVERQPVAQWKQKALSEANPQAAIEALIALSRVGRSPAAQAAALAAQTKSGVSSGPVHATLPEDAALQKEVLQALGKLDFKALSTDLKQPLLRAWQLAFTRFGKPDAATCEMVAAKLDPLYPQADALLNRELAQLLVFLDSKTVVAKTVPQLATVRDAVDEIATDSLLARNEGYANAARIAQASRPNRQAISLAAALRNAKAGWTPELRRTYFAWFQTTRTWKGGNSFPKFMENIRKEALDNFVPAEERAALDELSQRKTPSILANAVAPKGPGRAYSVDEIVKLTEGGLTGRNFEQGKAMYTATLCAACHRFGGDGGSIGPDLTGSGNRYTIRDLAENIVEPSKVISDQYGSEEIIHKDGNLTIGRVVGEENGKLMVMASPLTPNELTGVPVSAVKERKPWNVSMMPPGLINSLNEEELKDLIAYIQSGGNPSDKAFQK
jgi:putative heme-binding domain-containing protein